VPSLAAFADTPFASVSAGGDQPEGARRGGKEAADVACANRDESASEAQAAEKDLARQVETRHACPPALRGGRVLGGQAPEDAPGRAHEAVGKASTLERPVGNDVSRSRRLPGPTQSPRNIGSCRIWRKGDSRARGVTTFQRFAGSGSERDSPSCRRRPTLVGWSGRTSLTAHARSSSCLQALSAGSIEPAACRTSLRWRGPRRRTQRSPVYDRARQ